MKRLSHKSNHPMWSYRLILTQGRHPFLLTMDSFLESSIHALIYDLWLFFGFKLRKHLYLQILHSERSFVISFFPLLFCLVYYFYRYEGLSSFNFIHPPNNIYYYCTWVANPSILYHAVCGVGHKPTMIPHHHIFIKIIKCGVLFNTYAVLSISDWHDKAKLGEL